ncbi:hypothetical protein HHI36_000737 [Cryptolaemus montrouzieri]|uniref:Uncharacterized protein n=1 Tax=Cryptolaemus montrouzieri TaxID=559131 RepID=A0ABD2P655_9CUCU
MKTEKNNAWDQHCQQIETLIGGKRCSEVWKFIRGLKSSNKDKVHISITEPKKWKDHYANLLQEKSTEYRDESPKKNIRVQECDNLLPKIRDKDSHKPYSRRKNATLNNNLELSSSSISPRVESFDNNFPESYPEHNKTISKNHFDPESSGSYDPQLETNDNENHLPYIEEENAISSYHLEIASSSSAFPPSASPTPVGIDDIFSISCNSGNSAVLHLTRLMMSTIHQSSSRSSNRSGNERSEQSKLEIEEIEEEEGEKKGKTREANPEKWITKKATK